MSTIAASSLTVPRRLQAGNLPAWLMVAPFLALLATLYVMPLFSVLWLSFSVPKLGIDNYLALFSSSGLQRVLLTTFRVSLLVTLFSLVLGYLIAYVMLNAGPRHRIAIATFVLVPFWVSVLVRAFAWLTILRSEGLLNTALMSAGLIAEPLPMVRNEFGVVLAMTHYMIPYAVLPIFSNMKGIDPRLASASRSLGAGPVRTFTSIFLPLSMPGVFAAGLLVFILSLGFLVTPALIGGGRVTMIAEYVRLQIFQTVRWGVGTMMASVLLITVLALLAAMARVVDVKKLFGAK